MFKSDDDKCPEEEMEQQELTARCGLAAGVAGRGVRACKSGQQGQGSQQMTMETTRTSRVMALGLALAAFCLLVLPPATWALPGGHLIGERKNLSPDDPQVQRVAQVAVANYNMGSNSAYYFRDTHILRAESQLVSGIKYYLSMVMGSTPCRKTAASMDRAVDLTICPLSTGAQEEKLRCDFEILVVPWKNSTQILKDNCVPQ
ncbi:PREDICTED: cystatin-M [Elephantulus edwardii]|uniref:cystatin-M n=1 Tax=Elephantulus edwardii TaxID=28737 RepID=UPI0003F0E056|nr:PREDICTED: cystatin-M [Elephantulus edwardii]